MISRRVREARVRRGWSAQHVADLCADAGMPDLNRSVIANLETGRRKVVSIEEVLTLAHVLRVPPVWLFTPIGTTDDMAITPRTDLAASEAMMWVCGRTIPGDDVEREVAMPVRLIWWLVTIADEAVRAREAGDVERHERLVAEADHFAASLKMVGVRMQMPAGQAFEASSRPRPPEEG